RAARARAEEMLKLLGIPEPSRRLDAYPHQLSGGMRQRAMIGMALSCRPSLLIADEPTTALDVTVQAQILDLLQSQQRERYMAMILVTHDLGVVAGRADEIAVMYAGRIVEKAPTAVLFREMRHPYSEALVRSIPQITNPSHTRLQVIFGRPPDLVHPPTGCKFSPRCPYVQDKCRTEEPPLLDGDTPGHAYRCWFPVGTPEGRAALERNRAEGRLPVAATVEAVPEADATATLSGGTAPSPGGA
ncbi:MAG: ABC transporter ATP-binding protein, partial [Actinobacteria bacterium]|nr:ABC transporter ATP-binding protein [Actinomycetota bacterium]